MLKLNNEVVKENRARFSVSILIEDSEKQEKFTTPRVIQVRLFSLEYAPPSKVQSPRGRPM